MGDIKSAREIAMEKVQQLGEATEDERLQWKHRPLGEQIGHRYLADDENMVSALSHFDEKARKHVKAGASLVLLAAIALPKNDATKNTNRKAMEGLRLIKNDKTQLENSFSRMRQLFTHYADQGEKQRKQAYQQLKYDIEARIRPELEKQQFGSFQKVQVDVEKLPQFQQEWRKVLNQLDTQYLMLLKEYKEAIEALQ
jgi:hypothetical protein